MEGNVNKKIVFFAIVLVLDIILLTAAAIIFNIISPAAAKGCFDFLIEGNLFLRILIGVFLLALAVLAVLAFIRICMSGRNSGGNIPIGFGDAVDNAFVSSSAVNMLSERFVRSEYVSIKKCKCSVKDIDPNGITLMLNIVVANSANMAVLCADIHRGLSEQILETTGVHVKDVIIQIADIIPANSMKSDSERRIK